MFGMLNHRYEGISQRAAHLDGAGQDVVGNDLIHKALVFQEALQVQAKLGERGVDSIVGGQEEGDASHGVRQDVCAHTSIC